MALFVQIDHFRKTDQKPTVKNHLFSISWFRSFNRTSFQQQLKLSEDSLSRSKEFCFNRTSFQQQLKLDCLFLIQEDIQLQSYILSTTTETFVHKTNENRVRLQSYILSTTTETFNRIRRISRNRLQSYILSTTTETGGLKSNLPGLAASIVHPFNNN